MMSPHRIPPKAILCVFKGAIQQRHLGGEENTVDEESNKKLNRKEGVQLKKVMPLTKILLCTFAQNIVIALPCQCGLFIHTCVSKNSIVSKDVIFYLL